MKLPPWFRIAWWLLLTGCLTWLLYPRFPALRAGQGSAPDVALTLIWIALALSPLFVEIELFGLKFKAQVEELKKTVKEEVGYVRTELRSAIDVRNQLSQNIVFPTPSSDAQLSELRDVVRAEFDARLGGKVPPPAEDLFPLDENIRFLFATRYNLEQELRRIGERQFEQSSMIRRPPSALQITRGLVDFGLVEPDVGSAIREVYAVCSAAIHGNAPNDQQLAFVRDVAPRIIETLKAIGSGERVL